MSIDELVDKSQKKHTKERKTFGLKKRRFLFGLWSKAKVKEPEHKQPSTSDRDRDGERGNALFETDSDDLEVTSTVEGYTDGDADCVSDSGSDTSDDSLSRFFRGM